MNGNYMPGDQLQAAKEIECVKYLMSRAIKEMELGDIDSALGYYELIGRSLRELHRMRKSKRSHDRVNSFFEQLTQENEQEVQLFFRRYRP